MGAHGRPSGKSALYSGGRGRGTIPASVLELAELVEGPKERSFQALLVAGELSKGVPFFGVGVDCVSEEDLVPVPLVSSAPKRLARFRMRDFTLLRRTIEIAARASAVIIGLRHLSKYRGSCMIGARDLQVARSERYSAPLVDRSFGTRGTRSSRVCDNGEANRRMSWGRASFTPGQPLAGDANSISSASEALAKSG